MTSRPAIRTLPIVSLLALIVFTAAWAFTSAAIRTIPQHSLRANLFELGRPIQAVALPPYQAGAKRDVGDAPQALSPPTVLQVLARPLAQIVSQLSDPLGSVAAPAASSDTEVTGKGKSSTGKGKGPSVARAKKADGRHAAGDAGSKKEKKGRGGENRA